MVAKLVDAGLGQRAIAAELGVARNTLARHLGEVLMVGRARRRLEYLEQLEKQARAGSTSATKALLRITDRRPRVGLGSR